MMSLQIFKYASWYKGIKKQTNKQKKKLQGKREDVQRSELNHSDGLRNKAFSLHVRLGGEDPS